MKKIPLGIDDYKTLKTDCYYVDKTVFISSILKNPVGSVLLFTRPRRFGKTLALSMIDTFFDNKVENNKQYFSDTNIINDENARKEMGEYPVIFLSFKDCHALNYEEMVLYLNEQIAREFKRHSEIENSDNVDKNDVQLYHDFVANKYNHPNASSAIFALSKMLYDCHKKRVILLIDEYDTPIQSAFDKGFYDLAINYIKHLYGTALKGNNYLKYAICSGITRVGKESIFSGLNNVVVNSVLDNEFGEFFGFTSEEVKELLRYYGHMEKYDELKEYYNGYVFGENEVFNPWSTLYYIRNNYEPECYWANTSSDSYILYLIEQNNDVMSSIFKLMNGEKITIKLLDSFTYGNEDKSNVLSLLVNAGYLTCKKTDSKPFYNVYLPNQETKELFSNMCLTMNSETNIDDLLHLKEAFMTNNPFVVQDYLNHNLLKTLSYYDFSNEKNYQMMVLTMISLLFKDFYVKSEYNSGLGRCDIVALSKTHDFALLLEIKQTKNKASSTNLKQYAQTALKQAKEKEYYADILKDYQKVIVYGIAFHKNSSQVISEIIEK